MRRVDCPTHGAVQSYDGVCKACRPPHERFASRRTRVPRVQRLSRTMHINVCPACHEPRKKWERGHWDNSVTGYSRFWHSDCWEKGAKR